MKKVKIKSGLRDIKTTTGLIGANRVMKPHDAFLKLSSLEIEKHRLKLEKDKAEEKIKSIKNRINEIDKKESALLKFVEESNEIYKKEEENDSKEKRISIYSGPSYGVRERILKY